MKKKHLFLAALAIVLILCSSIGAAIAYFTTYAGGNGGYVIHLGHKTVIDDTVEGKTKKVVIHNEADPGDENGKYPVFVRAQVFHGSECTVTLNGSSITNGWYDGGDEFFYYRYPIFTGEHTGELKFDVEKVDGADVKPGDPVDVLITYQSVPAMFDPDGNALLGKSWENQDLIKMLGTA